MFLLQLTVTFAELCIWTGYTTWWHDTTATLQHCLTTSGSMPVETTTGTSSFFGTYDYLLGAEKTWEKWEWWFHRHKSGITPEKLWWIYIYTCIYTYVYPLVTGRALRRRWRPKKGSKTRAVVHPKLVNGVNGDWCTKNAGIWARRSGISNQYTKILDES